MHSTAYLKEVKVIRDPFNKKGKITSASAKRWYVTLQQ